MGGYLIFSFTQPLVVGAVHLGYFLELTNNFLNYFIQPPNSKLSDCIGRYQRACPIFYICGSRSAKGSPQRRKIQVYVFYILLHTSEEQELDNSPGSKMC